MTAALRVLALAMLLAVRARTLSNGVGGYYGWTGNDRYTKLDKFLHDRMGLGGNKSEPAALTAADRGLWSRTATAASVAVPENEDDGGDDDDDDDEEEEEPVLTREPIKLRHQNNRWDDENAVNDKVIIIHTYLHLGVM